MGNSSREELRQKRREHMLQFRPKTNLGKKYRRSRTHNGPPITKKRLRKAIKGSCGSVTRVAKRLAVCPEAVHAKFKQPGWEHFQQLLDREADSVLDLAEKTVVDLINQKDHLPTTFNASKFVLTTKGRDRGYTERKEVTLQGGTNPIQVHNQNTNLVDVDTLNLPVEVRRVLLNRLEEVKNLPTTPQNPTQNERIVLRVRRIV